MDLVPPDRWPEVEALFAEIADLAAAERADVLDGRAVDPAVRADLERLLAAHDRVGGFLDELDVSQAALLLSDEAAGEGDLIGRYRIVRRLGRGGMGVVYLAHDPRLDRRVALKLLPPHVSGQEPARRRLVEEAKAASALDHPHIATIYEIGETGQGQLFIAMAYYEGETLRERIGRGPRPVAEVVEVAAQVAEGLAAAHRRGIIHRDIKPANVIVTPEGIAKIVDFGVARGTGADLTREGSTLGTVAYMSPEQTRGSAVDRRADLWSLGVVLYEMLAGVRPFEADSEEATVVRIRSDAPVPVGKLRPEISPALARVVERCLVKDPTDRYASAEHLLADLGAAAPAPNETGPHDEEERPGLVVLPFVNISPDPDNEYLSDGLTEEVIADLSQIRSLRVISRTSAMRLKESDRDVRMLARELGVRYVLEGSLRRAGDTLRVSAKLVDARSDALLWSRRLDGAVDDIFEIQEAVARAIVGALRLQLSQRERQALAEHPISDVRAYESYLRARYETYRFSQEGLERAQRYIETALSIVGDNELLYSTLGHVTAMHLEVGMDPDGTALERVEVLAEQIFALNPGSARGYWLRTFVAFFRGDIGTAIRAGEHACELEPDDPDVLLLLGYVYAHAGYNAEALALFGRALRVDPLTPLTQGMPGLVAVLEGRFAEAVEPYRRCYTMEPESPFGAVFYGWALAYDRRADEAVEVLHEAADRFADLPLGSFARSFGYALQGESARALQAITPAFESAAHSSEMFARELCHCYALVGEIDTAFYWLEREIELGMLNEAFLTEHDWFLDSLRAEQRFEQLMNQVRAARGQLPEVGLRLAS